MTKNQALNFSIIQLLFLIINLNFFQMSSQSEKNNVFHRNDKFLLFHILLVLLSSPGFPGKTVNLKIMCKVQSKHQNAAGQDVVRTIPVVFAQCFSHDSEMSQRKPRMISTQFSCCHILRNAQSIYHRRTAKYKPATSVYLCGCEHLASSEREPWPKDCLHFVAQLLCRTAARCLVKRFN